MQKNKVAFVTGITGQDGAYLSELLLKKGYTVHGLKRRASQFNTQRLDHIDAGHAYKDQFFLHYGDLTDSMNLMRLIQEIQPDEIYNLAAQSHVAVSFETPEYTANADAVGVMRILEAIRILKLEKKTKFYQASTSELYGKVQEIPQTEKTPFYPRSPYGVAKLYGYWITVNYREAYDIHASNGVLFNHESPLRGDTFVTKKITRAAARIATGLQETLALGNLDSKRDWGHAREYVEGMYLMLQQPVSDDYVLATGRTTPIRDFVRMAFSHAGIELNFVGKGAEEVGICKKTNKPLVKVDARYFRPAEVDLLVGDYAKAKKVLGWSPKISVEELCQEMVQADLYRAKQEIERKGNKLSFEAEEVVHAPGGFLAWFEKNVMNR